MGDLSVPKIKNIDIYTVRNVLASSQITDLDKETFLRNHSNEIRSMMYTALSSDEYNMIILNRPLVIFKPIKNAFTKKGDKVLLAQALEIPTKEIENYVRETANTIKSVKEINEVDQDKIKSVRAYVYRHGSKEQVATFLDQELSSSKNTLKTIHKTLEYHTGGIADYFMRPIHRMDNKTLIKLYNTMENHLKISKEEGKVTEEDYIEASKWIIQRLYVLQSNSKLINAIKNFDESKK